MKEFFGLGYMSAPNTVFENIFQLKPGEFLVWNYKKRSIRLKEKYYTWEIKPERLDYLESYLEDTDLKIDVKHNLNKEEISSLLYRTDNSFEDVDKLITYTKRELEGKFANHMASGVEVKKALEEIKDLNNRLDKFIRNYQNI